MQCQSQTEDTKKDLGKKSGNSLSVQQRENAQEDQCIHVLYFITIKNDKYENYVEIRKGSYESMSKKCRTPNNAYTMITTM